MSVIVARHLEELDSMDEYQRIQAYDRAWDAYNGRLTPSFVIKKGQADDNVAVNYARLIVDKGVSFLFGNAISFEQEERPKDKPDITKAELWLKDVWYANKQTSTLQKLGVNGGVCGHGYIKIVPRKPFPRIIVLDPKTVRAYWSHDDIDEVIKYVISYPTKDPKTGKMLRIDEIHERNESGFWTITIETIDVRTGYPAPGYPKEVIEWPFQWCAIHDCQNLPNANAFYGTADLEDDIIKLNKSINFVLSNINRILRYHAHPKTWGRGFNAELLQLAVDETLIIPSETGELKNLEMQTDLNSSVDFFKRLKEAIHQLSRVPEVAAGQVDELGNVTGLALAVMYQPLIEKTETKRGLYGEMLERVNTHLLEIGGFGADIRIKVVWPEVLPRDGLQELQMAQLKAQLQVSFETIHAELGYKYHMERQRVENELEFRKKVQETLAVNKGTGQPVTGSNGQRGSRDANDKQEADNQRPAK